MQVKISPSKVHGMITAPASKSAMQRACAAALLRGGETILNNPGVSADDEAALNIIQQLGADVERRGETIVIHSHGVHPRASAIDCGESGLSARMFTSIAALSHKPVTITGSGSLVKRPFSFFTDVLPLLGVAVESNGGVLPLHIKGPLQPKGITVDGSLSSQFLTGLLMAYSAAGASDVTISVSSLASKPYIDLTLQVMQDFGLPLPVNHNYQQFHYPNLPVTRFPNHSLAYTVEGDWSGGAFLLVAGAIAGDVVVSGLNTASAQADKAILKALSACGAETVVAEKKIRVKQSVLMAFEFDATDCPDLFPPLVALAAYCTGTSIIKGTHRLQHKESSRALTLQEEFGKLGIDVRLQGNEMLVKGGQVKGAAVHSRHDHRIAMACAVAALGAAGDVMIEEAEAVKKSYSQFWEHLLQITRS